MINSTRSNALLLKVALLAIAISIVFFGMSANAFARSPQERAARQSMEILDALTNTAWMQSEKHQSSQTLFGKLIENGKTKRIGGTCEYNKIVVRIIKFEDLSPSFRTDIPYLTLKGKEEYLMTLESGTFTPGRSLLDKLASNNKYTRSDSNIILEELLKKCEEVLYFPMTREIQIYIKIYEDSPTHEREIIGSVTTVRCGDRAPDGCFVGESIDTKVTLLEGNSLLRLWYSDGQVSVLRRKFGDTILN